MDTLQIDSTQLVVFRNDARYDYDRELVGGSQNLLEWLAEVVSEWLNETFDVVLDSDVTYWALLILGALVVAFALWLYWRFRPKLFVKGEKNGALDYDVTEDTIYGVDFDKDISKALKAADYRQAVRLLYLQTLLHLQNTGRIDWQPSRTPAQYMRQADIAPFSDMSRHFIQVRYGNYQATSDLFDRMKALQKEVMLQTAVTPNGQTAVSPNGQTSVSPNAQTTKKGGEP